jgi:hypothetical protein
MSGLDGRLRRLEESGGSCPECGLTPKEHGRMAVVYPGEPEKGFRGDTSERCARCGRSLYTVLRVVYEGEAERLAP